MTDQGPMNREMAGNRFARHPIRTTVGLVIIALLSIEGAAALLVMAGRLEYTPFRVTPRPTYWVDDHPSFGVWHPPHAEFRDRRACFDVTYRTNAFGARDRERSLRSTARQRVVVLGDSFVEGIGVEAEKRVTDVLEAHTGIEHLNFGTAGDFGTIQAWLLYDAIAADFDHSEVMLFVLPDNDFDDNDPSESKPTRYRPYLRRSTSGFELYYPVAFAERDRNPLSPAKVRKNRIFNASYFLNAMRHASHFWRQELRQARGSQEIPGYTDFTEADLDVFFESIRRLLERMGPSRPLHLVLIPRADEFLWVDEGRAPFKLPARLRAFAEQHPQIHVVDLMPGFLEHARRNGIGWDQYFLPCDGHWSALGHEVASEILLRETRHADTVPAPLGGG